MQMIAGKYVPPHMRGSKAEPTNAYPVALVSKGLRLKKVHKKPVKKTVQEVKTTVNADPKVKPHCELFIADIPASMRSVTSLAGFFHPYGEIANIQMIPIGQNFPVECSKFVNTDDFETTYCAIIEFLTARVAKFVVGVLRKRIEALNFRIGLLKPGLAEEMLIQENRLKESLYMPSYQLKKTQEDMLNAVGLKSCSSEELSERAILRMGNPSDPAYWTGSSGISSASGSENGSDSDRKRPTSESSDDDDCDLLALAIKNGIKVTRS